MKKVEAEYKRRLKTEYKEKLENRI